MEEPGHLLSFINPSYKDLLTTEQQSLIMRMFEKETYKKKSQIFLNGTSNTRHYFVIRGLLRLYIIESSGKEFNLLFAREGQILGDLSSPKPTMLNLDCIEDSVVYSISTENLEQIRMTYSEELALDSSARLKRAYIFLQNRLLSILSRTAEENYIDLKKHYPELLDRLPQYHIASYIGIRPEFLSKIISKTARKRH